MEAKIKGLKYRIKHEGQTYKGRIRSRWEHLHWQEYFDWCKLIQTLESPLQQVGELYMHTPEVGNQAIVFTSDITSQGVLPEGRHVTDDGIAFEVDPLGYIYEVDRSAVDYEADMYLFAMLSGLPVNLLHELPKYYLDIYFRPAASFIAKSMPKKAKAQFRADGTWWKVADTENITMNANRHYIAMHQYVQQVKVGDKYVLELIAEGHAEYILDVAACWLVPADGTLDPMKNKGRLKQARLVDIMNFWTWFDPQWNQGLVERWAVLFESDSSVNPILQQAMADYQAAVGMPAAMAESLGYKLTRKGWKDFLSEPIHLVFTRLYNSQQKSKIEQRTQKHYEEKQKMKR